MGEVMTRGIINMPLDMVMGSINGIENYHSTAQSLLADYDALRAENAELVAALIEAQKIINHQGWSANEQTEYDAIESALAKHRGDK